MARSVEEIKTSIVAKKDSDPLLNEVDSSSAVADWNLWAYMVAVFHNILEQLWDAFKVEIQQKIDNSSWGTAPWYIVIAKLFQLGDTVEQLPDNQPYSVVDVEKQIVTRASFREGGGVLTLKVAKGDAENPEALTSGEKTQFEAYINKMKAAGTEINVISLDADQLRINATIYYDALYAESTISAAVETAIINFLFKIPFDGIFYKNKSVDAIDDVLGVINVDQDNAIFTAIQGLNTTILGSSYEMQAGYMQLDIDNSSITYIGR